MALLQGFADSFYLNFIKQSRYLFILNGLGITVSVTIFAAILGLLLGVLVAVVRSSHDLTGRYRIGNAIAKVYITVVRGTPVVVQLMIVFYIVFRPLPSVPGVIACILAFGLNSGAYVAEIVRGGIMSIDKGQMEAGRSLGFTYNATMRHIILPQTFKNVLPSLGNEIITLLKETSVAGFIGVADLTQGANIIRSRTFDAFFPLLAAAGIYLAIVMLMTAGLTRIERRLRRGDR